MEEYEYIKVSKGVLKHVGGDYHVYNTDWLLDNLDREYETLKYLKEWKEKNKDRNFKKELEELKLKIREELDNEI